MEKSHTEVRRVKQSKVCDANQDDMQDAATSSLFQSLCLKETSILKRMGRRRLQLGLGRKRRTLRTPSSCAHPPASALSSDRGEINHTARLPSCKAGKAFGVWPRPTSSCPCPWRAAGAWPGQTFPFLVSTHDSAEQHGHSRFAESRMDIIQQEINLPASLPEHLLSSQLIHLPLLPSSIPGKGSAAQRGQPSFWKRLLLR